MSSDFSPASKRPPRQPRRLPSMAGYGLEITGYIPKE